MEQPDCKLNVHCLWNNHNGSGMFVNNLQYMAMHKVYMQCTVAPCKTIHVCNNIMLVYLEHI